MSRIAKNPIEIPNGVTINMVGSELTIKGAKGTLSYVVPATIKVVHDAKELRIEDTQVPAAGQKKVRTPFPGTAYARIKNMVQGVSAGFDCKLELVGVGYRAQAQGKQLNLTLGFSHPVIYAVPEGIQIETPSQTEIIIKGIDKHLVGQVAANIRKYRSPEPYKGKGIRYAGEIIILKETKKK